MTIGNDKNNKRQALATGLRFEKDRLIVELDDQREVSVPLHRYPTLQNARPRQRDAWELIGPGKGFHWKDLDFDLSVPGLISGLPEVIPAPPARRITPRQVSRRKAVA